MTERLHGTKLAFKIYKPSKLSRTKPGFTVFDTSLESITVIILSSMDSNSVTSHKRAINCEWCFVQINTIKL